MAQDCGRGEVIKSMMIAFACVLAGVCLLYLSSYFKFIGHEALSSWSSFGHFKLSLVCEIFGMLFCLLAVPLLIKAFLYDHE